MVVLLTLVGRDARAAACDVGSACVGLVIR